jgi:energy-coupling factor transporter ATP-binding protein EcfA2
MKTAQKSGKVRNILELSHFSYFYPHTVEPALRMVNLNIAAGEFILLAGRSGSGKSSLARALCGLIPDFYGGSISGKILYKDILLDQQPKSKVAEEIGILFQEPDKQLLFRNVERDIAFGLENLGFNHAFMQRRVAEIMDFLNLNELRKRDCNMLSGGEKQKIALAGVLATNPRVLILDEPTSQLDPVAATEFLDLIKNLNDEFGITIIIIEQRLDKVFPLVDRVVVMEAGNVAFQGSNREYICWALHNKYPIIPTIPKIFAAGLGTENIPISIKEGREKLDKLISQDEKPDEAIVPSITNHYEDKPLVEIDRLNFSYTHCERVIKEFSLKIWPGECVAIIGSNGAGKSTLLQVIAGLLNGYQGKIRVKDISGKRLKTDNLNQLVAYLPQNLDDFFLADTVEQDVLLNCNGGTQQAEYWLEIMNISKLRNQDPRKLSTGEKQKVALAAALATDCELILLDEPTTGIDGEHKERLGELLYELCQKNKTVLFVTHDIDFASAYAQRLLLMHDGQLLSDGLMQEQLLGNIFYTSQVARLFRDIDQRVANQAQAINYIKRFRAINKRKGKGKVGRIVGIDY